MEQEIKTIYDVMEDKLSDDSRSLKTIKELGKELIEKIRMIDTAIIEVNPQRFTNWNELDDLSRNRLMMLTTLKNQYRCKYDMILVVLNKSDEMVSNYTKKRCKELELNENLIIKDLITDRT